MPRGFKGLSEVNALDDKRARDLVLGNWHKLNAVLQTQPTADELRRLLALEIAMGHSARPNFVERLRSALARARSRESREACRRVTKALMRGTKLDKFDLQALGLAADEATRLGR